MTTLTMRQAAEAVGMAYRTFRRDWPRMVADQGFPNPFRPYTWDAALVREWRLDRSRARANDATPAHQAGRPPIDPAAAEAARARAEFQAARRG